MPLASTGAATQCQAGQGYDFWCFSKCFLFDFLILVFSEKALASSNSFLRVAGDKRPVSRQPPGLGRLVGYCRGSSSPSARAGPAAHSGDPGGCSSWPRWDRRPRSQLSSGPEGDLSFFPHPPPELALGCP